MRPSRMFVSWARRRVMCFKQHGELTRHWTWATSPMQIFDNLDFAHTAPVAEAIMESFESGEYDRVELLYNRFVNAAVQDVMCEQMLPIEQASG